MTRLPLFFDELCVLPKQSTAEEEGKSLSPIEPNYVQVEGPTPEETHNLDLETLGAYKPAKLAPFGVEKSTEELIKFVKEELGKKLNKFIGEPATDVTLQAMAKTFPPGVSIEIDPLDPTKALITFPAVPLFKYIPFDFQMEEAEILEGPEVVEVTLTGLTPEEAEAVIKQYQKSKSDQEILVHKKVRKEIGTGAKPITVWPFESSSTQVNGEPLLYKTQLNEDGTLSCNCLGWCMGSAKNKDGRFCKHTKEVEVEAKNVYKKWKNGEPLGDDFEAAPASIANATSKSLFKALKAKPVAGEATIFKAKRIVEV